MSFFLSFWNGFKPWRKMNGNVIKDHVFSSQNIRKKRQTRRERETHRERERGEEEEKVKVRDEITNSKEVKIGKIHSRFLS